ncbi:SRPBCC family protein [Halobacteriales archaeon QH_10_67_22]|nr:MAG: SRPBCC family protein [Halobacteriales archaeon QH_10_67_22]
MIEVSDSIRVDAPVEAVFAFMDDPHNHVTVTPSLAAVRNVEPLDNGGKRLEHTFRMAGVSLEGELVERTHEEDARMLFEMRGQLAGEIELVFEPADGGTELTYTGRYDLPGRVLSAVAEPFVRRYNERELRTTLANVKTHVETAADA